MKNAMSSSEVLLKNLMAQQNWPQLVQACRKTLRKAPRDLWAHRFLGFALFKLHRAEECVKAFEDAAKAVPLDMELALNHGNTLMELGQYQRALPKLEAVVQKRPDRYVTWMALSKCLYQVQEPRRGLTCAERMLALAQTNEERATAVSHRGLHRRELGEVAEAVADCNTAIELFPPDVASYVNRQLFMLADPRFTAVDIHKAATEFAHQFEDPIRGQWPTHSAAGRGPWDRLKVGFLSPDFRVHSVMYFVEGLLAQLDRRQFEVHALYLHPVIDAVTERVRKHVDVFTHLGFETPEEKARLIREGQFDILIDLAGHTGGNGLLLMAQKLAPVQVSWLGYPATTGLTAIDYKFTDQVTDPPGADAEYSERLYRMNTLFCCYRPHSRNPLWRYQPAYLVQPTPALSRGYVTFGSCNNLGKLTDDVLALWGELLHGNANYRLLIEGKNLDNPEFAAEFEQRCGRLGIPLDRLTLVGLDNRNQYLTYHDIDIALDPFPLTGGTTTFDLLWMGVPLVSMEGRDFKSRLSTGMLRYLGQTGWLADTPQQYLAIAHQLAADVDQLNAIRQGLRQHVEASCLMDEDRFVQEFGLGLRTAWQRWLVGQVAPGDEAAQAQHVQQWQANVPDALAGAPVKAVGMGDGQRVERPDIYAQLQHLLDVAKQAGTGSVDGAGFRPEWVAVTQLAETVLCAIPHDPLALACLAEVEHAHGHTDFAVTYLRYAQQAMQG